LRNFIVGFCIAGFWLTLLSPAMASSKFIERCGICVPSKTIKPSKKGEIVKECLFRECTNSDPKKSQKLADGKIYVYVYNKSSQYLFGLLLRNNNPVVYREYEDEPGKFVLSPS
jgi:hypothetical protein